MKCIAVFRSRNQALTFERALNAGGISARAEATPDWLRLGCGLSVGIDAASLSAAKNVLSGLGLSSFYGWYDV